MIETQKDFIFDMTRFNFDHSKRRRRKRTRIRRLERGRQRLRLPSFSSLFLLFLNVSLLSSLSLISHSSAFVSVSVARTRSISAGTCTSRSGSRSRSRTNTSTTNTALGGTNNDINSNNSNNNNNNNNPISSMIENVASSLIGGDSKNSAKKASSKIVKALLSSSLSPPSWIEIQEELKSLQTTKEEKDFRCTLSKGYGTEGNPMNEMRLYDDSNKEEDARVTFYRDSASWCPYCQKVWIALEFLGVCYKVEKINMRCYGDKPSSFLRIQPGGQIPLAIINGKVYNQSNDILIALETIEGLRGRNGNNIRNLLPSLSPPSNLQNQAQQLYRLERELFSAWMGWLTGGYGKQNYINTLRYVDSVLVKSDGPFFLGKKITLVDVQFAPFLERMVASLLYFKGYKIRVPPNERADAEYPGINAWFDAMEELPAYQLTKSDYYTHVWDLPPQLGGCKTDNEDYVRKIQDAIDGKKRDSSSSSWDLPLQPDNGGIEPDWTFLKLTGNDEAAARREAVERISNNYVAIAKFACRGAASGGMKGFQNFGTAPLSDPNAAPNEEFLPSIDACLKAVCSAMLKSSSPSSGNDDGDDDEKKKQQQQQSLLTMESVAKTIATEGGSDYANGVVKCLSYLRDRIGVPRDMRLPAARQLRAYLNWSIAIVRDAASLSS